MKNMQYGKKHQKNYVQFFKFLLSLHGFMVNCTRSRTLSYVRNFENDEMKRSLLLDIAVLIYVRNNIMIMCLLIDCHCSPSSLFTVLFASVRQPFLPRWRVDFEYLQLKSLAPYHQRRQSQISIEPGSKR